MIEQPKDATTSQKTSNWHARLIGSCMRVLSVLIGNFSAALILMAGVGLTHDGYSAIPALGYFPCLGIIFTVSALAGTFWETRWLFAGARNSQ